MLMVGDDHVHDDQHMCPFNICSTQITHIAITPCPPLTNSFTYFPVEYVRGSRESQLRILSWPLVFVLKEKE